MKLKEEYQIKRDNAEYDSAEKLKEIGKKLQKY